MIDIIIPTRNRVGVQRTLAHMAPELRARTIMVAPASEYGPHCSYPYMAGVRFLAQPDPDMTIAQKRAWILKIWYKRPEEIGPEIGLGWMGCQRLSDKIVMLDDDLRMYVRREDRPDRLRYAESADQVHWFGELEKVISAEVPHAGFGPRQGNDKQAGVTWQSPGRMMLALGYHVPTVVSRCELGRIETREDFDVSLQLLRQGLKNMVCHHFCVGQGSYNEAGGASEERTLERSNSDAHLLARLHSGLVRVVQKDYKGSPREEVVIAWAKALKQGIQWREGNCNHEK